MPALFAYLIAVGLLLGGGYGALNWLAAPEPVKVAATAKPAPHREARPEATSQAAAEKDSGARSAGPSESSVSDEVAARTDEVPPSPPSEAAAAAAPEQSAKTGEISGAAQIQQEHPQQEQAGQEQTANAEVSPAEAAPPAQAASAPSPGNQQTAAATAPATIAKTVKRPHQRQAGGRSEKPAPLALMTLRTIEYADGRRVTQLIPYRNPSRAPAFGPDD